MRDRDFFDDEEYNRGRYGRGYRQTNPRDNYASREGYNIPSSREGYQEGIDRDTYNRDMYDRNRVQNQDRYSTREPLEGRNEQRFDNRFDREERYEPRYQERYRPEYAERENVQYSYQTSRSHLRCRDIMTRDVVSCRRDSNLREVARLMRDEDTGAIPVLDEGGKVIGIVTDRDIIIRVLADRDKNLDAVIVEDAMTDEVFAVRPNDRVVDCIKKMGNKQVRRILVTDDHDRLKGIISLGDVATEAEYDRELAEAVEDISKPKSWFKRLFS